MPKSYNRHRYISWLVGMTTINREREKGRPAHLKKGQKLIRKMASRKVSMKIGTLNGIFVCVTSSIIEI